MRIIIIYIVLNLCILNIFSQENEVKYDIKQVVGPSPEAASLGKYGEIPISLNTGLPNIDIPLYELNGQGLSLPLSISYHNTGFKPIEVSSSVGLGWTLNAGGVITRKVKGWPDEYPEGYYESLAYYHNFVKNSPCEVLSITPSCMWRFQAVSGCIDLEPDEFYFNFNGYSGSILVNEKREVVCFPEQNFKIEFEDYQSWSITTSDGIKYLFDKIETSDFRYGGQYISAWYLTQITSLKTNDVIYLDYIYSGKMYGSLESDLPKQMEFEPRPSLKQCESIQTTTPQRNEPSTETWYVSKIKHPKSSAEIRFEYKDDRKDAVNADLKRLEKITVTAEYNPSEKYTIREYAFNNNTYFGNISDRDNWHRRLKLSSITENISQSHHSFEYNENSSIPPYNSINYDHWGYYNNANNTSLIPPKPAIYDHKYPTAYGHANKQSKSSATQECILKKITYPTGGYTEFTWEPNIISFENIWEPIQKSFGAYCTSGNISMNAGEKSLAEIIRRALADDLILPINVSTGIHTPDKDYDVMFSVTRVNINQTGGCYAFLYEAEMVRQLPNGEIAVAYPDSFNPFSNTNCVEIANNHSVVLKKGKTYVIIALVSSYAKDMSISASGAYSTTELIKYRESDAGGLRIARVSTHDGISSENDIIKTYYYTK